MMLPEKLILDHLKANLTVPVFMEHQETDPEVFVIAERVGGSKSEHIQRASFALQSYGKTMLQAALLNDEVKQAMDLMIESPAVSAVELDSDYNYTDTQTKHYRYQAVYDLVLF